METPKLNSEIVIAFDPSCKEAVEALFDDDLFANTEQICQDCTATFDKEKHHMVISQPGECPALVTMKNLTKALRYCASNNIYADCDKFKKTLSSLPQSNNKLAKKEAIDDMCSELDFKDMVEDLNKTSNLSEVMVTCRLIILLCIANKNNRDLQNALVELKKLCADKSTDPFTILNIIFKKPPVVAVMTLAQKQSAKDSETTSVLNSNTASNLQTPKGVSAPLLPDANTQAGIKEPQNPSYKKEGLEIDIPTATLSSEAQTPTTTNVVPADSQKQDKKQKAPESTNQDCMAEKENETVESNTNTDPSEAAEVKMTNPTPLQTDDKADHQAENSVKHRPPYESSTNNISADQKTQRDTVSQQSPPESHFELKKQSDKDLATEQNKLTEEIDEKPQTNEDNQHENLQEPETTESLPVLEEGFLGSLTNEQKQNGSVNHLDKMEQEGTEVEYGACKYQKWRASLQAKRAGNNCKNLDQIPDYLKFVRGTVSILLDEYIEYYNNLLRQVTKYVYAMTLQDFIESKYCKNSSAKKYAWWVWADAIMELNSKKLVRSFNITSSYKNDSYETRCKIIGSLFKKESLMSSYYQVHVDRIMESYPYFKENTARFIEDRAHLLKTTLDYSEFSPDLLSTYIKDNQSDYAKSLFSLIVCFECLNTNPSNFLKASDMSSSNSRHSHSAAVSTLMYEYGMKVLPSYVDVVNSESWFSTYLKCSYILINNSKFTKDEQTKLCRILQNIITQIYNKVQALDKQTEILCSESAPKLLKEEVLQDILPNSPDASCSNLNNDVLLNISSLLSSLNTSSSQGPSKYIAGIVRNYIAKNVTPHLHKLLFEEAAIHLKDSRLFKLLKILYPYKEVDDRLLESTLELIYKFRQDKLSLETYTNTYSSLSNVWAAMKEIVSEFDKKKYEASKWNDSQRKEFIENLTGVNNSQKYLLNLIRKAQSDPITKRANLGECEKELKDCSITLIKAKEVIKEIKSKLSLISGTLELQDIRLFSSFARKQFEKNSSSPMKIETFNKLVQSSIKEFKDCIKSNLKEVNKDHLPYLINMKSYLDSKGILVKLNILTTEEAEKLLGLINIEILKKSPNIGANLSRFYEFIVKVLLIPNNSAENKFLSSLEQSLQKPTHEIVFTDMEWNIISKIAEDIKSTELICKSSVLLEYFEKKSSKHIQSMIVNSEGSVSSDVFTGLRALLDKIKKESTINENTMNEKTNNKSKYSNFLDALNDFLTDEIKTKLESVVRAESPLFELSKELDRDQTDRNSIIKKILVDSSTLFSFNKISKTYSIKCLLNKTPSDALNYTEEANNNADNIMQEKSTETSNKKKSVLYIDSLVDCRIKLTMLSEILKQGQLGEDIRPLIEVFPPLISSIESISDLLTRLVSSGYIFDLKSSIMKQAKKSLSLGEDESAENKEIGANPFIQMNPNTVSNSVHNQERYTEKDLEALNKLMREKDFSISIRTSDKQNSRYYTRHVLWLKNILTDLYNSFQHDMMSKEANSNRLYTRLDGLHKHSVASFIVKKSKKEAINGDEEFATSGIIRYITGESKVNLSDLGSASTVDQPLTKEILDEPLRRLSEKTADTYQGTNSKRLQIYGVSDTSTKFSLLYKILIDTESTNANPYQFFFANSYTSIQQVQSFLATAIFDTSYRQYFMIDLQTMNEKSRIDFIRLLRSYRELDDNKLNRNIMILVDTSGVGNYFYQELTKMNEYIEIYQMNKAKADIQINNKPHTVTSKFAGLGKTSTIESLASKIRSELVVVLFSGDTSEESISKRLEIIADKIADSNSRKLPLSLHLKLDMMDSMHSSCVLIDHILFRLCYLKCIPYKKGYLYLNSIQKIFIEVQNSFKNTIMSTVSYLQLTDINNIEYLDNIDSAARGLKPSLWQEQDPDFLQVVGAFLYATKTKDIKRYSLKSYKKKLVESKSSDMSDSSICKEIIKVFILGIGKSEDMESSNSERSVQDVTYSQIRTFAELLYHQAQEMENSPNLDKENNYSDDPNLPYARIIISEMIVELMSEMAWSCVSKLRDESKATNELHQKANKSITTKDLKEYQDKLKNVKSWDYGNKVGVFFFKGSMKLMYKSAGDVSKKLAAFVSGQIHKNSLPNYSSMSDEQLKTEITTELINALSIVEKVRSSASEDNNTKGKSDEEVVSFIINRMDNYENKGYVITHDNYLKILMIIQRARMNIPIVIMGATGCGKTYMVEFICRCLLEEEYYCLTLHTGVTEEKLTSFLVEVFEKATTMTETTHWVLFDEFNTSPLQCLVSEIMVDRTASFCKRLKDRVFPQNIVFVAACNPYRISASETKTGLKHSNSEVVLTHRVYPIPDSLMSHIWYFGQLTGEVEKMYIKSMLNSDKRLKDISKEHVELMSDVICDCQRFLRDKHKDNSVSLRDVYRFVTVFIHYALEVDLKPEYSIVVSAYICYLFRLESKTIRAELENQLRNKLNIEFLEVFSKILNIFAKDVKSLEGIIPASISLNIPLKENLLAIYTALFTKLPLIICGKPGTSKSIAVSFATEIFLLYEDRRKNSRFFKNCPTISQLNLWGSLTTTSSAIQQVFDKASEAYNTAGQNTTPTIIFDEIGLAEIAPENPLKVLHPLLEPKRRTTGFIGLSNFVLDKSKMNRLLYLARPDMDSEDLLQTCDIANFQNSKFEQEIKVSLKALAEAFFEFREEEQKQVNVFNHPNFHGSRDFYEAVKVFTRAVKALDLNGMTCDDSKKRLEVIIKLTLNAIQRNFSGKKINDKMSYKNMSEKYFNKLNVETGYIGHNFPSMQLIYQNILESECRHLMIFTSSTIVEEILISQITEFEIDVRKKSPKHVEYICRNDSNPDFANTVLSKLSMYIKHGYTIILKNLDEIYSCMYDLLNLNYSGEDGKKYCDLYYGTNKMRVEVNPDFKCIVLAEREDTMAKRANIEKLQPAPLLNRFEKYLVVEEEFIPDNKKKYKERFERMYLQPNPKELIGAQYLIHNLSKELIFSTLIDESAQIVNEVKFRSANGTLSFTQFVNQIILADNSKTDQTKPNSVSSSSHMAASLPNMVDNDPEDRLFQLYSRNMLLVHLLESKQPSPEFEEKFKTSHPYNNMGELIRELNQRDSSKVRSAVVFTYSNHWQLKEAVDNISGVIILECGINFSSNSVSFQGVLEKYIEYHFTYGAIIFQIMKKKDWHLMNQLKTFLETYKHSIQVPIIVVAHTMPEELTGSVKEHLNQGCRVNFLTKEWMMVAMDNLIDNNIDSFVKLIKSTVSQVLKEDKWLDKEMISIMMQQIVESNDCPKKQTRTANAARQFPEYAKELLDREKKSIFDNDIAQKKVEDLLMSGEGSDLKSILANHLDVLEAVKEYIKNEIAQLIEMGMIARTKVFVNFNYIGLATLMDDDHKIDIFKIIEDIYNNEIDDDDDKNPFINKMHCLNINSNSQYFKMHLLDLGKEKISMRDTSLNEPQSGVISKLVNVLNGKTNPGVILNDPYLEGLSLKLIGALKVLDSYIENYLPEIYSDDILKLIYQIASLCLNHPNIESSNITTGKIALIMVLVTQLYHPELCLIIYYLKTMPTKEERSTLLERTLSSISSNGPLIPTDLGLKMITIESLTDLESIKENMIRLELAQLFMPVPASVSKHGIDVLNEIGRFILSYENKPAEMKLLIDKLKPIWNLHGQTIVQLGLGLLNELLDLKEIDSSSLISNIQGILVDVCNSNEATSEVKSEIIRYLVKTLFYIPDRNRLVRIAIVSSIVIQLYFDKQQFIRGIDVLRDSLLQNCKKYDPQSEAVLISKFNSHLVQAYIEASGSQDKDSMYSKSLEQTLETEGEHLVSYLESSSGPLKIVTLTELEALCRIRITFERLQENKESMPRDEAERIDQIYGSLLNISEDQEILTTRQIYALLIGRKLADTYRGIYNLPKAGYSKISQSIIYFTQDREKEIIVPDTNIVNICRKFRVNTKNSTEASALTQEAASIIERSPFLFKVDLLNLIFDSDRKANVDAVQHLATSSGYEFYYQHLKDSINQASDDQTQQERASQLRNFLLGTVYALL